jgi:hypothetical protein
MGNPIIMTNKECDIARELTAIELDLVSGGCSCPPGCTGGSGCPGATNVSYRTDSQTQQTYVTYLDCNGRGHFYEKLQG